MEFLPQPVLPRAYFTVDKLLNLSTQTIQGSARPPSLNYAHKQHFYVLSPLKTLTNGVSTVCELNFLDSLINGSSQKLKSFFVFVLSERFLDLSCFQGPFKVREYR